MTNKIIITGGAGFIGCNAASRYLRQGHHVVVIDDLSRRGTRAQSRLAAPAGPPRVLPCRYPRRRRHRRIFEQHADADLVLHLGRPGRRDHLGEPIRARISKSTPRGSFNILEAARKARVNCPILYSSTNKVYGGLEDLEVVERRSRVSFGGPPGWAFPKTQPLDFHSPYGCSKGAADQYFRDYYRIYGLKTVVLRQSCIYGYRQFGVEDQGWVAWFIIAARVGQADHGLRRRQAGARCAVY